MIEKLPIASNNREILADRNKLLKQLYATNSCKYAAPQHEGPPLPRGPIFECGQCQWVKHSSDERESYFFFLL